MRQFCVNVLHFRSQASPEALAKAVLAEVPGQLTEYMKMNKIVPRRL